MGMGRVWKSKFELEKPSVFGKRDFDLWGKLTPKNACPFDHTPRSPFPHVVEAWELFNLHIFPVLCSPSR